MNGREKRTSANEYFIELLLKIRRSEKLYNSVTLNSLNVWNAEIKTKAKLKNMLKTTATRKKGKQKKRSTCMMMLD